MAELDIPNLPDTTVPVRSVEESQARPKGYWDLVSLQFRKNKIAVISVYTIGVLFFLAAWTPIIINGKPYVWSQFNPATQTLATSYPLFQDLVAPEYNIDLIFNYFLIATLAIPLAFGVRWMIRKFANKTCSASVCWIAGAVLALLPFLGTQGLRMHLMDRNPYPELAQKLDASKGERAIFTLIGQDPITPTSEILKEPDGRNFFGTDLQGRDALARMMYGARISLSVGFVAEGIAVLLGVFFGALAGFYRGWIDIAISRFIEIIICFPTFFLILVIIAYFETRSIFLIMLVIGVTSWPGIARLVRGEFLKLNELDYVQSARALGASSLRVMFRHMLPNAMGPVLVSAAFGVAGAILTESGLSYLGFGAEPPTPTWGEMISQGKMSEVWWLILFPGLSIFLTVTIYNLAGDGLRDAMDPKMRK